MPMKLNGVITDPDWDDDIFIAEQYISPRENTTLAGDWWINVRTETREIPSGHGLCLWSAGKKDRDASDLYEYYAKDGSSMKYALQVKASGFQRAKKGGFFSGSNYKNIIRSCKEPGVEIEDILILTASQAKFFQNRAEHILPNRAKAEQAGRDVSCFYIDDCFRDQARAGGRYDGLALYYGLGNVHPAALWFNLDYGDCTMGDKAWTVLMTSSDMNMKDNLAEQKFDQIVHRYSSLWNKYTMREYLRDYQETIGKQTAKYAGIGPFDCNHHLVIAPNQIPNDWTYQDGKWYARKKPDGGNSEGVGFLGVLFG